jgi:TolB-like protein
MSFIKELKRRNVIRVAIAYAVATWLLIEVSATTFPMLRLPEWTATFVAVLLMIGFPVALIFAWAYELTPEGLKKEKDVDRSESITHVTGRKLDFTIIAVLVLALGYFAYDKFLMQPVSDSQQMAKKSIAVLPFVNLSSDQEQEWFADGLTEEILNSLARTPDLLVASRTSSFQYKGRSEDISTIAAALGVAHVLEGSVRRGGDRLRVTAQLIRARDGFHLWSETFDRDPQDVIAIQENVAIEIATALETAMDPEALQKMVSTGTASVAAYESYLEGLALEGTLGETGNIENWEEALQAFERAVAIDEDFALAHWHASVYWESQIGVTDIGSELSGLSTDENLMRYMAAVNATIDAEDDEVRALKYRANKAENELRLTDARSLSERYVQEYPNDIEGLNQLISTLALMRDAAAAREHLNRLAKISRDDPLALNSLIVNLLFVGLHEDAAELARDVLSRYPQHSFLVYQAHRALLWNGDVEWARQWADVLRGSEFPDENIMLVMLRQACAEKNYAAAESLFEESVNIENPEISIVFILLQIMNRPDEAHQALIDADLDIHALSSFLNYPYFNHTYFSELAKTLEQQSIDRPFITGPPYRCETTEPISP